MAGAKLVSTRYPGVFKSGKRYAYDWSDAGGKRRRGSAETLEAARVAKAG